ncbi:MAG: hypothetical protein HC869_12790 [Rhodospirillales bacterium]|nr:hypothetical protein [Rhodospirillales bacterium]
MLIGKTNTPEWGHGSHTFNPVFGTTLNPYDLSCSAGGSSGGAAAALAARLVPVADGSDMMGSLRNPAAFCNVYGFRPTFGLVPSETTEMSFCGHFRPKDQWHALLKISHGSSKHCPAPTRKLLLEGPPRVLLISFK